MEVKDETKITRDKAATVEAAKGGRESKQLVAKQNTSTPIWKHFGFKAESHGNFATHNVVFVTKKL